MTQIIIGIDPGPRIQSCVAFQNGKVLAVREFAIPQETDLLRDWIFSLAPGKLLRNVSVCCEWIESYGMAVGKETFETVFQVGRMQETIGPMRLIPRKDVKMHLCDTVRAKDANVRQALIDKLGPVGTKKNTGPCYGVAGHYWAALAVAVTASELPRTAQEAEFHRGVA